MALISIGQLRELTGYRRNHVFVYDRFLEILWLDELNRCRHESARVVGCAIVSRSSAGMTGLTGR